ncbi:hypothetical protein [Streptomyces sp. NPDC006739]|uniref:hypothetical protein n=1 Tax=Streptomyces sp. NPDC006739 TaxID=3364763 RepID=UPI003687C69B
MAGQLFGTDGSWWGGAGREIWIAVAVTVVVGFGVLFSGVVSSVLAGASTALLLALVLPVTTPAPLARLPERLAGAGLAAAVATVAVLVLWPRPTADPLSSPAARSAGRQRRNCSPTRPSWRTPRAARAPVGRASAPSGGPPTRPPPRRWPRAPRSTPLRTGPPGCPPARVPSSGWSTS